MADIVVETQHLQRIYRPTPQREVHALRDVNLRIQRGQFVVLRGRSGSGKTTLLNCIGGLDRPTSGTVTVLGKEIDKLSDAKLTRWRLNSVGFIFQSFGLVPTFSAYENVELVLRLANEPMRQWRERTRYCLDLVGLDHWRDHRPFEMSGGQQQRLAIARAIVNTPQLILADEPTGELDTTTATDILTLFQTIIAQEGTTLLMTSHDILVSDFSDAVLHLADGTIQTETA